MEKGKITLNDIARIAGVTIGTVDRAMHNRSGISEKTRQKILDIAKEYDYKPDIIGRSLSMKRKRLKIGVLLRREPTFFWDHAARGIRVAAKEMEAFGINPQIEYFHMTSGFTDEEYIAMYRSTLIQMNEDHKNAFILVPVNHPFLVEDVNFLNKKGIPVVTLNDDREDSQRIFHIGPDTYQSGRVAAQLTGGLLSGQGRVLLYTANYSSSGYFLRKKGFMDKMHESYPDIHITERNQKTVLEAFYGGDVDIRSFDCICNIDGATVSEGVALLKQKGDVDFIKYIGFEINSDVKEHLADGSIHAVISQDAFSQGYFALRMLCEYLVYAKQPKYDRMFVRCDIILKENMIINDRIVNPYFMGD
ncbi:MAG TPA: hypothetical protein DDZ89_04760 [Clostridiales bacterium]|nr:hypothetical protein [Clostridiales bacterium]